MTDIKIVCGANYGDEGKGLVTNWLTDERKKVLNVLSCNSSQRGHTVVHNGIRHVFRHFGSGTLKGAHTLFTKDFIINPVMFREEYCKLKSMGITPTVFYDPYCCVVTPYDMLSNQIIETNRGATRHGSCGCGVWESIYRRQCSASGGYEGVFFAKSLWDILDDIERYYNSRFFKDKGYFRMKNFCLATTRMNFIDDVTFFMEHATPLTHQQLISLFSDYNSIIFENSQGLLISKNFGGDELHTTPADIGSMTPASNISLYCSNENIKSLEFVYVTRTYYTRHGVGPIGENGLSECSKASINLYIEDKTNETNEWQGQLRYGLMSKKDIEGLIHRISADSEISSRYILQNFAGEPINISKSLIITHANEYYDEELRKQAMDAGFNVKLSYDEQSVGGDSACYSMWNNAIRW